jgi:hypothetical protein
MSALPTASRPGPEPRSPRMRLRCSSGVVMSSTSTGTSRLLVRFMTVNASVPKQNGSVRAGRPHGVKSEAIAPNSSAVNAAHATANSPDLHVSNRGRTVAACTRERILLADALERRGAGDPELTFVLYMCAYAGDVARGELPGPHTDHAARGELPGPHTDHAARRYARACLIPSELLERPTLDVRRAAAALGVPPDELQAARHDRLRAAPAR